MTKRLSSLIEITYTAGLTGNILVAMWPITLLVHIRRAMESNNFIRACPLELLLIRVINCSHVIMTILEHRALSYHF